MGEAAKKIGFQLRAHLARILKEGSSAVGRKGEHDPPIPGISHQSHQPLGRHLSSQLPDVLLARLESRGNVG
jgi:hypothetical protein